MRVAFYGGSFNPPHYGHFLAAAWALCSGEIDQVWMVPCFDHAFGKTLAPYEHRIAMCRLGAKPLNPQLQVSTVEQELGGTSYTIDTVEYLQRQHPDTQFRLLVGTDILHEKNAWKEFDRLLSLAPLLVVPRATTEQATAPELPAISSSHIRELLQQKQDPSSHIPPPILTYIQAHHLYPPAP